MIAAATLPLRRCDQCWDWKPEGQFVGARGGVVRMCADCRGKYRGWERKSLEEKVAARGPRVDAPPAGYVLWTPSSHVDKLGGIPASWSERGTCPPSCGLYNAGCYSGYGKLGAHWRAVGPDRGLPWGQFLDRVGALRSGQLWRHNVAGDLPGAGEDLDAAMLRDLVAANAGACGFSFTHKHRREADRAEIARATFSGFTVNLSADTLSDADRLADYGVGPVVVVLPHDAPPKLRTPAGRHVVMCPAQVDHAMTCARCRLCARPARAAIIGFRAHGQFKKHVPELVQLRRKAARS